MEINNLSSEFAGEDDIESQSYGDPTQVSDRQ